MTECETIGLYIHVPFCTSKCGYCDFYSHVGKPDSFEPLVDAILTEFQWAVAGDDVQVETIFIGGGTPTVLPVDLLERLLKPLGRIAQRHGCKEFTVEANPATVDPYKAGLLADCGVQRISMGAQSFNHAELAVLERTHQPADVPAGMEILRRAGISRFNLDLIFGIPGQSLSSWRDSLRTAIALAPEHLSCYGLTYEPGTPLRKRLQVGKISAVGEEVESDMYLAAMDSLAEAGYRQYEISNYARPGFECLHNLRYWHNLPGLGLGPSAASYWKGWRWRNIPDEAEYVRCVRRGVAPAVDSESLSPLERAGETAMLALRLVAGIERRTFAATTGFDPFEIFATVIPAHVSRGVLAVSPDRIRLTREGRLLADAVIADFLSPGPPRSSPVQRSS